MGNTLITILEFVLFFGMTIFIHELGHFLAGRLFKVEIEEFGFGYPPRMLKLFTSKGTLFSLNWIPFGGFVRLRVKTIRQKRAAWQLKNRIKGSLFSPAALF